MARKAISVEGTKDKKTLKTTIMPTNAKNLITFVPSRQLLKEHTTLVANMQAMGNIPFEKVRHCLHILSSDYPFIDKARANSI